MNRHSRLIIALLLLLSGLALLPRANLFAGSVTWQRFAGGYEDVVTVTHACYDAAAQELQVRATSTSGGVAVLTVYRTSDNAVIGTLIFNGSDYSGEFDLPANPLSITVRSSLGGEDTEVVLPTCPPPPTAVEVADLDAGAVDQTVLFAGALALVAGLTVLAVAARRR